MAFSTPVTRGSAVDTVSDNSIAMNPSAALAVGRFIVVGCATKNLQTTDGASNDHSTVADSKGHVWAKHEERTETAGAAGDGTTVSIWSTMVTTQIETTDTITLTTSGNIAEKIITATEVQVGVGMGVSLAQVGLGPNAIEATVSGLVSREYFLIGVFGAEGSDTLKTPDADYTERHDERSRNNAAAITIHVQTRIATLTTDTCTSTAWTATDPYALLAAFFEEPIIPVPVGAATLEGQTPSRVMNHIAAVGVCVLSLVGASMGIRFAGPETGALTLAGQAPTVSVSGGSNTNIAVPVGSLALAGQAPSLGLANPAPAGSLLLAGQAPSLSIGGGSNTTIAVPVGALTLAGQAPLIGRGIGVPVGALTLAGTYPAIAFIDPPPGTLVLTGLAPTLSIGGSNTTIAVPAGALALTGTSMDVSFQGPETGALVFTGQAPTLSIGSPSNTTIAVPVGALTLAGQAPLIGRGIGVPVGALTMTGLAPTVTPSSTIISVPAGGLWLFGYNVNTAFGGPPAGALTLSGLAPTVSITAAGSIAVPVGSLTLSGLAPAVSLNVGRAMPAGALVLSGVAPTASVGIARPIPAGALALSGQAPTVAVSVALPTGSLALSGLAPTLQVARAIAVPAGSVTLTGLAPTASVAVTVAVPTGSLTLTGFAPTVSGPVVIAVPAGALTLAGLPPTSTTTTRFNPAWAVHSNQWIGPMVSPQ